MFDISTIHWLEEDLQKIMCFYCKTKVEKKTVDWKTLNSDGYHYHISNCPCCEKELRIKEKRFVSEEVPF